MTEVIIRNKELLQILDGFVDTFRSIDGYNDPKYHFYDPKDAITRGDYYCNEYNLELQKALGDKHSGFPEQHFSQPVSRMANEDPDKWKEIEYAVKNKFPEYLGAHSSALFNYYPPGGFVGWHTNWNANAYQILFTWSETGEGYFKYWDNKENKVVIIPDVAGWQCRWYYFGHKDEPEHHCWHSAYTECDRITLAYKVLNDRAGTDKDRKAVLLRDQIIEDIESEE